ncbi:MAG: DNA helicase RecQ [Bacteroidia bacterium]|nr:DNA helicase RecQ [Bacteroidia bacterium]
MQTTNIPQQILKKHFGFEQFRPLQEEIIQGILQAKDTLVLMPTGGGKSICFQVPALLLPHLTLVVSPLIALMKDQVDALKANGISAAYLNSSMDEASQYDLLEQIKNERVKLLYVSPEKLLTLIPFFSSQVTISLIAIDEAHCISAWGHDFRPEYTRLKQLKEVWPQVPIIALTATADKITRKDILHQLSLQNPEVFIASFDRPNLSLTVRFGVKKKKKMEEIISFIHARAKESGIIYCLSRKATEEMAADLQAYGISADYYHAGMSAEERSRVQEEFINDKTKVICATIAFGMGIDKSNVRFVIHNSLPKNMEGYYQEIGRAGRDGLPSDTLLYYSLGDVIMLRNFIEESGQKELNLEKLNRMQQYAEAPICRRKILLAYFGETLSDDCHNCDVCKQPKKLFDGTELVQKALSALHRTNQSVGTNMLIDIIRGSHRKEIIESQFHLLKTYGVGKDKSFFEWQQLILQMINLGLLEIAYDESNSLKITDFGNQILYGRQRIQLVQPEITNDFTGKTKTYQKTYTEQDQEELLFEKLRASRRVLAEKENVPAYIIFSDATLKEIVSKKPQSLAEFIHVNGMGEHKVKKYGNTLLKELKSWQKEAYIKVPKADTYKETLALLQQGFSVEEIAETRQIQATTIYSHVAHLYQTKQLASLDSYITTQEIELVKKAKQETGESKQLAPIYLFLKEEVPYHIIRLCLSYLEREEAVELN